MKIYNKKYILNFDGGHLSIGAHADFDLTNQMTIAAWIKPQNGTEIQATILSKTHLAYEPQIQNNKLVLERGSEYAGASNVEQDKWVHLVITFDAADEQDNLKFYINGDLDKSYSTKEPLAVNTNPLLIGARADNSLVFKGAMTSVAIWNTAHSGWEVKKDFGSPLDLTDEHLIGYWQMEDGTGTTVKDLSTKGHDAEIKGEVSWEAVTDPIVVRPPRQQKVKNTTVQRISQLLDHPDESHLEDHSSLPGSGRNGEATKFLNRVNAYKGEQLTAKKRETNAQIQEAKASQAAKLEDAHIEAAKKMNSTRFDQIWFIFKNKIYHMDPLGRLSEFHVGNIEKTTVKVPAKSIWFDTNIDSGPNDTLSIRYVSGKWNISPQDKNLKAVGTTRFKGRAGYALQGKPAGGLIGKVSGGIILAIGMNNKLFTRNNLDSDWASAPDKGGAVIGVTIMPNGTILAIGTDKKLYTRTNLNAGWVKAPSKNGSVIGVTIMQNGSILTVGTDNKLYTHANLNAGWVKAPDKGGAVTGVSIMQDGSILAIGTDKKLYTRANLNASWVKAPDKGGAVIGITVMQDGSILAIGTDNKLYTRANLNSDWVIAPDKSGQVKGIAMMPSLTTPFYVGNQYDLPKPLSGRLYLTTNDDVKSKYGGGYGDNSGSLSIEVSRTREAISVEAADIVLDQGRDLVFWCQATVPFSLHVAGVDGSNHQKLVDHPDTPISSLALDEENQYVYHIMGTGKIMRVKYDGTDHETVLDISGPAKEHYWQLEIEPKSKKIFWTNDFSIWKADLNGANPKLVIPNHEAPFPIDLAVDGDSNKLYWVDKELEVVRRANLDGTEPEDLYEAKNPVRGLMLDYVTPDTRDVLKQEVYWAAREEEITSRTPGIKNHWPLDDGKGPQFKSAINQYQDFYVGVKRISDDLPNNLNYPSFALALRSDDYARVPARYINELSNNSFTIEMWIKSEDSTIEQGLLTSTNYITNKCIHLIIRNQKAYLGFYGNDTAGNIKIESNKWTHLAFRYDLKKKEQTIFVNGILDATSTGHAPLDMEPNALVWLGMYSNLKFNGLIADVRIIHQVLSQESIVETMNTHKHGDLMDELITGPVWDNNDSPPTLIRKSAVMNFDGIGSYLKLGDAKTLQLTEHSFTVESWVKITQNAGNELTILGTDTSETNVGLHLVIRSKKPYMGFYGDDLSGNVAIEEDEWNHIAFRYDADEKTQSIYLNGQSIGSRKTKKDFLGTGQVFVGRSMSRYIFNGSISDLRIWNIARTEEDIAANYKHYRESFALRGPVDGLEDPEYLFEIPAEGGMNLSSRLKAEYEKRLMAYRKRKENQTKAAVQIQGAHSEKDKKIKTKGTELTRTQQEKAVDINAKKAEHTKDREANRNRQVQAQNDKSQKMANARRNAQQSRLNANQQASQIKSKANSEASTMKSSAKKNRDEAKRERDKNKR